MDDKNLVALREPFLKKQKRILFNNLTHTDSLNKIEINNNKDRLNKRVLKYNNLSYIDTG